MTSLRQRSVAHTPGLTQKVQVTNGSMPTHHPLANGVTNVKSAPRSSRQRCRSLRSSAEAGIETRREKKDADSLANEVLSHIEQAGLIPLTSLGAEILAKGGLKFRKFPFLNLFHVFLLTLVCEIGIFTRSHGKADVL